MRTSQPLKDQWGGGILNRKNPKVLQRYNKNKKIKTIFIGSIIGVIAIIGGISLYRSFAMYEEKKTFDVLNGTVPDFASDIKLTIKVNGNEQENLPAKESGNYKVNVNCDKGIGSWDYNNWKVNIKDFKKNTKCTISFESTDEEIHDSVTNNDIKVVVLNQTINITITAKDYDEYYRTTTFDFSNIDGYENLSESNFIAYTDCDYNTTSSAGGVILRQGASVVSYEKETGKLTVQYQFQESVNAATWARGVLYAYCFYS